MTDFPLDRVDQLGLTASSVAAYLSTTGWSLIHDGRALQSWMYGDVPTPDHVLQLPTDNSYADYNRNLQRVLAQLEQLNGWDAQQLATQVLSARSDILYIRAAQYSSDGSIPVREAQALLDGAVEMVTAAARATYSTRASMRGRSPDRVRTFIDEELRMGHTQRGSFVITILTRLEGDPAQAGSAVQPPPDLVTAEAGAPVLTGPHAQLEQSEQLPPFQRQVMTSLATGLVYARHLVRRASRNELGNSDIDEAVSFGVTEQLCAAIVDMTGQEGVSALDLSFSWAKGEATRPPAIERIEFEREALPALDRISTRLRPGKPQPREVSVTGYVRRLERSAEDEQGVITVAGFTDRGEQRQVRVAMAGNLYSQAVQAHDDRQLVEVLGVMEREGGGYWMRGNVQLRPAGIGSPLSSPEP